MKVRIRQFATIVVAIGWLLAQNIALAHEYSSEHLSKTHSHICLSYANDLDDLVVDNANHQTKIIVIQSNFSQSTTSLFTYSRIHFAARAPPYSLWSDY